MFLILTAFPLLVSFCIKTWTLWSCTARLSLSAIELFFFFLSNPLRVQGVHAQTPIEFHEHFYFKSGHDGSFSGAGARSTSGSDVFLSLRLVTFVWRLFEAHVVFCISACLLC